MTIPVVRRSPLDLRDQDIGFGRSDVGFRAQLMGIEELLEPPTPSPPSRRGMGAAPAEGGRWREDIGPSGGPQEGLRSARLPPRGVGRGRGWGEWRGEAQASLPPTLLLPSPPAVQ